MRWHIGLEWLKSYKQWRQTGLTITSANRAGQRILWNKMNQHKGPIYYAFGVGQRNYQIPDYLELVWNLVPSYDRKVID